MRLWGLVEAYHSCLNSVVWAWYRILGGFYLDCPTFQKSVVPPKLGLNSPLFQSNPIQNLSPDHETFYSILNCSQTKYFPGFNLLWHPQHAQKQNPHEIAPKTRASWKIDFHTLPKSSLWLFSIKSSFLNTFNSKTCPSLRYISYCYTLGIIFMQFSMWNLGVHPIIPPSCTLFC